MISVIGAGPVGSYVSYLLSKKGYEVNLFEEHNKIGLPVQCTGLLTSHINEIIKLEKSLVVNKLRNVSVISPNNEEITLKLQKPNILVDRTKFDLFLANMAKRAGAKIYFGHKFRKQEGKTSFFKVKDSEKRYSSDILIGADGFNSTVAKLYFKQKRKFMYALQATVKGEFEKNTFSVYFGNDISPGFFAWIVPENEKIARVGLATEHATKPYFDNFVKGKGKILDLQAGPIPIYDPSLKIRKNNLFIVGDAATHNKASTHGGIVPGLIAAEVLAKCISEDLDYQKYCNRALRKDLMYGLLIRLAMNKFSDKDHNDLVRFVKNPKITNLIEKYDREFPSRFGYKLLFYEPRFLKFLGKMIMK